MKWIRFHSSIHEPIRTAPKWLQPTTRSCAGCCQGRVLKQHGHWTDGALINQVSSFAGEGGRTDVNPTISQPILSYITKTFTRFGLNAESACDLEREQWTVPLLALVQRLLKVGKQPHRFNGAEAIAPMVQAQGWSGACGFKSGSCFRNPENSVRPEDMDGVQCLCRETTRRSQRSAIESRPSRHRWTPKQGIATQAADGRNPLNRCPLQVQPKSLLGVS